MKYTSTLSLLALVLMMSGCRSDSISCDSTEAKTIMAGIASKKGLELTSFDTFSTLDESKSNETTCSAFYTTNLLTTPTIIHYRLTKTDKGDDTVLEVIE